MGAIASLVPRVTRGQSSVFHLVKMWKVLGIALALCAIAAANGNEDQSKFHWNYDAMGATEDKDEAMPHVKPPTPKSPADEDQRPVKRPCDAACHRSRAWLARATKKTWEAEATAYHTDRPARRTDKHDKTVRDDGDDESERRNGQAAQPQDKDEDEDTDRPKRQVTVKQLHRALNNDKQYREVAKRKSAWHAGKAQAHTRFAKLYKKHGLHADSDRHKALAEKHKALAKGAEKIYHGLTGKWEQVPSGAEEDLTPRPVSDDLVYDMQTQLYAQALADEGSRPWPQQEIELVQAPFYSTLFRGERQRLSNYDKRPHRPIGVPKKTHESVKDFPESTTSLSSAASLVSYADVKRFTVDHEPATRALDRVEGPTSKYAPEYGRSEDDVGGITNPYLGRHGPEPNQMQEEVDRVESEEMEHGPKIDPLAMPGK